MYINKIKEKYIFFYKNLIYKQINNKIKGYQRLKKFLLQFILSYLLN